MRKAFSTSALNKSAAESTNNSSNAIDHEIKLLHKQIALAEKSFALLIKNFTNISVDILRLQSRQIDLSTALSVIASDESPSVKNTLLTISQHISNVADSTTTCANVINEKMLLSMSEKVVSCKKSRDSVGECSTAVAMLKKHEKQERKWSRGGKSPKPDKQEIKLQNETLEVTKKIHELENNIEDFEKEKVDDLRMWLELYLHSNLAYHVKAVEEFTKAYQCLSRIDIDDHIEHLSNKLFPRESDDRLEFVRWNSFNSLPGSR